MLVDFSCPVENQGVIVKTNSKTGEIYALFKLFNISNQVVTGVSFMVRAFDAYGGELGEFKVELSDLNAGPKSFFAEKKAVSLKEYDDAKHITVDILTVDFAEGESYTKSSEATEIVINESEYEEKMRLASVAGADAFCYAQDRGTYWVCVCGRPNTAQETECVRCGRDKKEVFEKFSSRGAINKAIEEKEELQRQEEQKQAAEAAEKVKMRNKKIKKFAIIGAIVAVCLVALYFLISFIIDGVYVMQGDKAQKEGNLIKAYQHYRKADSKKIGEVSEQLRGNSASNLNSGGFMTSDKDNLYYVDSNYFIYKESKSTGEKTLLSREGGCYLNIAGDWLYYLDPFTQRFIARVKTDGSVTEHVFENAEKVLFGLCVVGDEIYFLTQELRTDLTPEMQEAMAMSGQTGDAYRNYLCRLKVGETEPERVSDADPIKYLVYKDWIYYIDRAETAVYRMNLKGKDNTKVVAGPVYAIEIVNDVLYYQDVTRDQTTGIPKFSLEKAQMDGTYIEPAVSERLVADFSVIGDVVYYIGADSVEDKTTKFYKKTATGDEMLMDDCNLFNVCEDYFFIDAGQAGILKTKFDKSGYEAVLPEEQESPAEETTTGETEEAAE